MAAEVARKLHVVRPVGNPVRRLPLILAHRYLKTIMLSLFIMNLFPLSFLDGGQVLQATADLLLKDSEGTEDLEVGGRGFRGLEGSGRTGKRKALITTSAELCTWILMGTSSVLGLVHWYRS